VKSRWKQEQSILRWLSPEFLMREKEAASDSAVPSFTA